MKSSFEQNGGTYRQVGDFKIPNLTLSPEEANIKLVNVIDSSKTVAVNLGNTEIAIETIINQVAGNSLSDENVLDQTETCTMNEFNLEGFDSSFNYTTPAYSVTSIRLKTIR